ncbi:hypothetical protein ANCCAN_30400 [Ancylostoma caninum]|uniref:Uncharacterized protein n=1 Tax=Ancylostoma caninum TaxID=29170 RepID=A0A368EW47_ANCCA|nr:hypothetical protein ANCCAN_30400 [Ancylostoma caninum]
MGNFGDRYYGTYVSDTEGFAALHHPFKLSQFLT